MSTVMKENIEEKKLKHRKTKRKSKNTTRKSKNTTNSNYPLSDLIFNKEKRKEYYKKTGQEYEMSEEQKEIMKVWNERRGQD